MYLSGWNDEHDYIGDDGSLFIFLAESARGCRDDGKAGRISVQE